jgi:hypothetical protein
MWGIVLSAGHSVSVPTCDPLDVILSQRRLQENPTRPGHRLLCPVQIVLKEESNYSYQPSVVLSTGEELMVSVPTGAEVELPILH